MTSQFECARCRQEHGGRRLLLEQNATDESGLHTVVEKRWTLCPPCAEHIMALVGEVSPWHQDSRTVVLPDSYDEPLVRVHALSR